MQTAMIANGGALGGWRAWMIGPAVFSPQPGQFYRIDVQRLLRTPRLALPLGPVARVFFLSVDVLTALISALVIFLACAVDVRILIAGGLGVALLVLVQRQLGAWLVARAAAGDARDFTYLYRAGLIRRLP